MKQKFIFSMWLWKAYW